MRGVPNRLLSTAPPRSFLKAENNMPRTFRRPAPAAQRRQTEGARSRVTRAMEELLEGEAEALTRRAVEMALAGDAVALKLCMDRLLPALREQPGGVDLPTLSEPRRRGHRQRGAARGRSSGRGRARRGARDRSAARAASEGR